MPGYFKGGMFTVLQHQSWELADTTEPGAKSITRDLHQKSSVIRRAGVSVRYSGMTNTKWVEAVNFKCIGHFAFQSCPPIKRALYVYSKKRWWRGELFCSLVPKWRLKLILIGKNWVILFIIVLSSHPNDKLSSLPLTHVKKKGSGSVLTISNSEMKLH